MLCPNHKERQYEIERPGWQGILFIAPRKTLPGFISLYDQPDCLIAVIVNAAEPELLRAGRLQFGLAASNDETGGRVVNYCRLGV
jgi:hypothetical protein